MARFRRRRKLTPERRREFLLLALAIAADYSRGDYASIARRIVDFLGSAEEVAKDLKQVLDTEEGAALLQTIRETP
jgi:hypothetical protein